MAKVNNRGTDAIERCLNVVEDLGHYIGKNKLVGEARAELAALKEGGGSKPPKCPICGTERLSCAYGHAWAINPVHSKAEVEQLLAEMPTPPLPNPQVDGPKCPCDSAECRDEMLWRDTISELKRLLRWAIEHGTFDPDEYDVEATMAENAEYLRQYEAARKASVE